MLWYERALPGSLFDSRNSGVDVSSQPIVGKSLLTLSTMKISIAHESAGLG